MGTAVTGTVGAAVTPAFAQSPTQGNLLVLWQSGSGSGTGPTTPAGWTLWTGVEGTTFNVCNLFWKMATGGDANPTLAAVSGQTQSAQVGEFSGCRVGGGGGQVQPASGTTSPLTPTLAAPDAVSGCLIICAASIAYSTANTTNTFTHTLNNGATATTTNNAATNTTGHYSFGYGFTTGNSSAQTDTFAYGTTGTVTNCDVLLVSVLPTPASGTPYLVKAGTVATSTTNTLSPTYGQATSPGSFLVCLTGSTGGTPSTPAGWSNEPTGNSWMVYWKANCGANETPPTITLTGTAITSSAVLLEFSGIGVSSTIDRFANQLGTATSGATVTAAGVDTASTQLVVAAQFDLHTTAETCTTTVAFNNGATANNVGNNDSTSVLYHYRFAWGITTGNSVADSLTLSDNGMKLSTITGKLVSFKSISTPVDVGAVAMSGSSGMGLTGTLPINYLQDGFAQTGGVDTTKWTVSDTNVATVQGPGYPYVLQITLPASSTAYHQLYSTYANYAYNYWNLTNNAISINCLSAGNQALTSLEVYPLYLTDETYNTGGKNAVFWLISQGSISTWQWVNGVRSQIGGYTAYSAYNHAFFRVRESAGTIYFDTSPNGNNWTNYTSTPDIAHINGLGVWVQAGTYNSETSATSCQFANLNIIPTLISAITDAFATAGTPDPTKWTPGTWGASSSGSVANVGGSLVLTLNAGAANGSGPNIVTNQSGGVCLIGSSCILQLAGITAGNSTTNVIQFDFRCYAGGTSLQAGMIVATKAGSPSGLAVTVGGVGPNWDPIAMQWLRIREAGGTIYYDYSPNGNAWTNFTTAVTSTVFPGNTGTQLNFMLDLVCEGTYIASTASVDNFNLPPGITTFAPGPNLVSAADSEFETALTGDWGAVSCTLAQTTAQARAGYGSLQITSTSTSTCSIGPIKVALPAGGGGQNYNIAGYVRAATVGRACSWNISFLTSGSVYISGWGGSSAGVTDTTTGWTMVSAIGMASPPNAAYLSVSLNVFSPAGAGEVHYLDSVSFSQSAGAVAGLTATPAIGATLNGATTMTIGAKVQENATLLLSGSTAMNVAGITTEQGVVPMSGSTGMTIGSIQTIPAAVAMSASTGINVSLSYRADLVGTTSMTVVGQQITGRRYSFSPSRIYIGGAAGAIGMVGTSGMTVGAIVREIAAVSVSATAGLTLGSAVLIAAQKMAVLQDAFATAGTPDTNKWIVSTSGGTVANSGGNLTISLPAGSPVGNGGLVYAGSTGTAPNGTYYDLTESYAVVQVSNAGVQTDSSHQVLVTILLYDQDGNDFGWWIQNNQIGWVDQTGAVNGRVAYVATTYQWLRIREHAGTTYFDYSANGNIWSNFVSVPDTTWIYPPQYLQPVIQFDSQTSSGLPAQTATFDNFNLPPPVTAYGPVTGNLLTGDASDFEASVGGWTALTGTTIATSTAQANTGTHSLALTSTSGGNITAVSAHTGASAAPAVPFQNYTVTAYVRAAATGRQVSIGINFYDSAGNQLFSGGSVYINDTTTGWTQGSQTWTSPANTAYVACFVMVLATATSEVHYVDTVVAQQAPGAVASLTVAGAPIEVASVAQSATSGMTVAASVKQLANVTLAGGASLNLSTTGQQFGTVALSGTAGMTVASTGAVTQVASVSMAATSTATVAGFITWLASVALGPANSTLSVTTSLVTEVASVGLSGTAGLTVTGGRTQFATVPLVGTGGLVAGAMVQQYAAVSMAGTGNLVASLAGFTAGTVTMASLTNLTVGTFIVIEVASVAMSASASASMAGQVQQNASITQTGVAALTVTGTRIVPSAVTMTPVTTLTATGVETYVFTISLSGTGTLTAAGMTQENATVAMSGSAGLIASLAGFWFGTVNMTPGTTLTVGSAVTEIASVAMNGQTTLNVFGAQVQFSPVAMAATAGLTVATSVQENAIVGTNVLSAADSEFETGVGFTWGGQNNTVARTNAVTAHNGSYCLAITATTTAGGSASCGWSYYGATPGQTYTASMWVMGGANLRNVQSEILFFAANGSTVVGSAFGSVVAESSSTWQFSTVSMVAPAGAVYVAVYWRNNSAASAIGEVHYVDSAQVLSPYGATASMTVGGLTVEQASVSLSATTTLTTAGTTQENASVALVPVSSLTVAATVARVAVVAMSGTGSLTVAPLVTELASVSMAATAHLSVTPIVYGFVTMASTASLALTVAVQEVASFAGVAITSLSVAAGVAELASVNLVGTGTLTATALRIAVSTVSMLPVSTLSLTNVHVQQNAVVSFNVTASLTMTYQALGVVSMAATAGLTMVARSWSIIQGQVSMSGTASLQVIPQVTATIHFVAVTSLNITARMIIGVAPGFSATTDMEVDVGVYHYAQVMMSVSAKLTVDADVRRKAPSLFDQIQALEGQDPIMVGATGYMDDIFTTRLVSDSE